MDDELIDLLTREGHSEVQWERMVGLLEGLSSARQAHVWSQVVNRVAERPPPIVGDVSQDQWLKLCLGKVKKTYMGALSDAAPVAISMPAAAPDSGLRARVEALEQRLNALGTEVRTDEASANRIRELEGQLAGLRAQLESEENIFTNQIQTLNKDIETHMAEKEGHKKASEEAASAAEQHRREAEAATAQAGAAKAEAQAAKADADAARAEAQTAQAAAAAAQANASAGNAAQAQLETAMQDLRNKIATLEAEAEDLKTKLAASEQAHSDGAASKDQEVAELKKKLKEAEDLIADLKNEGGKLLEQLDHTIRDKAIENEELAKKLADAERQIAQAEADHKAQVAAMEAKVNELEAGMDELTKKMADKEKAIHDSYADKMEAMGKERDSALSKAGIIENDLIRLRAVHYKLKADYDKLKAEQDAKPSDETALKLTEAEAKLKEQGALLQATQAASATLATTQAELEKSKKEVDELKATVKYQELMNSDELPTVDASKLQEMLSKLWESTTTFTVDAQRSAYNSIPTPSTTTFSVTDINSRSATKPVIQIDYVQIFIDSAIQNAFTDALDSYVTVWQSNAQWKSNTNQPLHKGYQLLSKEPMTGNVWLYRVAGDKLYMNIAIIENMFQNLENYLNPIKRRTTPPSDMKNVEEFMRRFKLYHAVEEDVTNLKRLQLQMKFVPAYVVLLGLSVMPNLKHDDQTATWKFPSLLPAQFTTARSRRYIYYDGIGKYRFSIATMAEIEKDLYIPKDYEELKTMMYPAPVKAKEEFDPDDFFLNFNLP